MRNHHLTGRVFGIVHTLDGDWTDIVNTIFFRHGIIAIVIVEGKTGAAVIRNFSKRGILDFFLKSFNQDGFCFRRQEEADEVKDIIAEVLTDCHGSAAEHGHQGKNSSEQNNRPFPAPSMHVWFTAAQLLGLQYVLPPYAAQNVQKFQISHAKPSSCSCAYSRLRIRNSIDFTLLTLNPDFSAISSVESRYQ